MTNTALVESPAPRVRTRVRPTTSAPMHPGAAAQVEIARQRADQIERQTGENQRNTLDDAKARALEALQMKRDAYQLTAKADKALKLLASEHADGMFPDFTVEFEGKTYDAKVFADTVLEVSIEKLQKEVGSDDLPKIVKASQGAVADFGGKTLLNKVLAEVTKDPEFKVKKRA